MMMDSRRLADVRAGTPQESKSSGTGYLVGEHLVLTCRHVVVNADGQPWSRIQVRLGGPGDGPQRRTTASVVWLHPDRAKDAALLRVEGEPFTQGKLVEWGWFACSNPVPYTGLGYPLFVDYESGRGVEQLDGTLPPQALSADGEYVLNQGPAPEAAGGRAWSGVSGAAVFCRGLLTAVVTRDDLQFGNRRLLAVPAHELFADREFVGLMTADTGAAPAPEAVELAGFLQPPRNPVRARTPGSLLAASVEAVDFVGRHAEVTELAAWRDGPPLFSVMLVAGEGGQGKTRLAREFSALARRAGWAAGFLLAPRAVTGQDDSQPVRATTDLALRLREAIRPVLLIADYAETRPEEVEALTDALISLVPAQPVRLLLLSRTAGAWWDSLTEVFGPDMTQRIDLAPLTDAGEVRRDTYNAAVAGLARHLAALPEPPTESEPGESWSALAERLTQRPPTLDDARLGNALTLQITALTDLLAVATGGTPVRLGESEERGLIRHERGYLQRAAGKRNLFTPGLLSERPDDHERRTEAWRKLERALAGTILLGPCNASHAQGVGMLASAAKAHDVISWLAALYPPPSAGFRLGTVQPDRLAELLLGPILTQQAGLLSRISTLVDTVDGASAGSRPLEWCMRCVFRSDRFVRAGVSP